MVIAMSATKERVLSQHANVWTSLRNPLLNKVQSAGSFHLLDAATV
jgi:hypothetical protein